jgi:hypothetical protein
MLKLLIAQHGTPVVPDIPVGKVQQEAAGVAILALGARHEWTRTALDPWLGWVAEQGALSRELRDLALQVQRSILPCGSQDLLRELYRLLDVARARRTGVVSREKGGTTLTLGGRALRVQEGQRARILSTGNKEGRIFITLVTKGRVPWTQVKKDRAERIRRILRAAGVGEADLPKKNGDYLTTRLRAELDSGLTW